jgi:predicted O-linked N-acetylglucosamine transferase (SPINDLY family)
LSLHLARHRAADLFLDTLPFNAHSTAMDALWAGLPVLTCAGKSFAGRVAASLLLTIELPELIASTSEEYEELAVELATNPQRLENVQEKLARNRLSTPLFDTRLLVKNLEAAYARIYDRHHENLPAECFFIA